MSDQPHDSVAGGGRLEPSPLLLDDPPKVGDFWLDARLIEQDSGIAYIAHRTDKPSVMLIMLSQGAANDAAARDRLAGEVNKLHAEVVVARGGQGQNEGRLAAAFRSEADDPVHPGMAPLAPWVALAYDGSVNAHREAERLLRAVDLSATPPLGSVSGPDFDISWGENRGIGTWRVWPLPGPGRHDRAGAMPLIASWALMITLTGLALLIAVLLFQNTPPQQTPPPVDPSSQSSDSQSSPPSDQSQSPSDQSASPSDQSASPSEQSASPSEGSGSPSDVSASPTESDGEHTSPSQQPSMGTSGTAEATATQPPSAPNTKL